MGIFWDGALSGSYKTGNLVTSAAKVYIGTFGVASPSGYYFNGTMDEVRVSDIARSENWLSTTYNTISSPATFMSFDAEIQPYPCLTFTLQGTTTDLLFPKPEWANPNNEISKNVDLFNMWSGYISTVDRGINTQSLSIGGTVTVNENREEWSNLAAMTTWLDSIETAMNSGEEFTINELGDCLNGVYVIKDFSFDTIKGVVNAWSWSLNLERVRDV